MTVRPRSARTNPRTRHANADHLWPVRAQMAPVKEGVRRDKQCTLLRIALPVALAVRVHGRQRGRGKRCNGNRRIQQRRGRARCEYSCVFRENQGVYSMSVPPGCRSNQTCRAVACRIRADMRRYSCLHCCAFTG